MKRKIQKKNDGHDMDDIHDIMLVVNKLLKEMCKIRSEVMTTKAEVLQAIADEKEQVLAAIEEFNTRIQTLEDKLANGTPVTETDLEDIKTAVHDIFVPVTEA